MEGPSRRATFYVLSGQSFSINTPLNAFDIVSIYIRMRKYLVKEKKGRRFLHSVPVSGTECEQCLQRWRNLAVFLLWRCREEGRQGL